ncbi:MAG: SRPBCC domain-containing protein [Sphingobacteriales bacterium]
MTATDFTTTLVVDQRPDEVFDAINNVRGWWTNVLEGSSQKLNDVFTVRFFDDVHVSTQKLVEVIPGEKVVWLVTDSRLSFVEDMQEWTNTKISFDITRQNDKTQLKFTHFGLAPNVQCYNDCVKGWTYYLGSLYKLITEGTGVPELK